MIVCARAHASGEFDVLVSQNWRYPARSQSLTGLLSRYHFYNQRYLDKQNRLKGKSLFGLRKLIPLCDYAQIGRHMVFVGHFNGLC